MLKSCSPINIMRVFISSKMLRLQFIGMKKQQTKAASTLCIGPDTFITPNQSTTTKLVSGSHSPQKKGDKDAEEVLRNNLRYNRFTKKWDAVR